jgi:hypothetical protein
MLLMHHYRCTIKQYVQMEQESGRKVDRVELPYSAGCALRLVGQSR